MRERVQYGRDTQLVDPRTAGRAGDVSVTRVRVHAQRGRREEKPERDRLPTATRQPVPAKSQLPDYIHSSLTHTLIFMHSTDEFFVRQKILRRFL